MIPSACYNTDTILPRNFTTQVMRTQGAKQIKKEKKNDTPYPVTTNQIFYLFIFFKSNNVLLQKK